MTLADEDEAPPPPAVSAYLRSVGWVPVDADASWARFRNTFAGEEVILEVPLRAHAPDYRRRFAELIADLRRIERRTAEQLLRDIRSSSSDVIKIRLRGGADGGRISLEHGARAFQRTRDLLLAAACAAVETRPVYSRRKPDLAMDYVHRTRFGPTEAGSFVITVESIVPPQIVTQPELPGMEPEPFDRAVGLVLARATTVARRIIDEVSMTSSSTPIVAGVEHGLSSNLCDALAGLIEAGLSQSVELRFRWAAARPTAADVPREVIFESETAPFLSEMARTLRERSTIAEFELVGPVYKLTSPAPGAGGEITVAMTDPWPGRKVRVELPGQAYQQATSAHGAGQWISVEGELVHQGGLLVLQNPRNFRVLT